MSSGADIAELALQVGTCDDATIDSVRRLLDVARHPDVAAVVAPLIRRELHYRVLRATHGAMVRALLRRESRAGRVAEAIAFAVGYRSPTQFSLQYARRFGAPPSTDRMRRHPTPSA